MHVRKCFFCFFFTSIHTFYRQEVCFSYFGLIRVSQSVVYDKKSQFLEYKITVNYLCILMIIFFIKNSLKHWTPNRNEFTEFPSVELRSLLQETCSYSPTINWVHYYNKSTGHLKLVTNEEKFTGTSPLPTCPLRADRYSTLKLTVEVKMNKE